jgi:hypothetical protein
LILQISVSWVVRITGMRHRWLFLFIYLFIYF